MQHPEALVCLIAHMFAMPDQPAGDFWPFPDLLATRSNESGRRESARTAFPHRPQPHRLARYAGSFSDIKQSHHVVASHTPDAKAGNCRFDITDGGDDRLRKRRSLAVEADERSSGSRFDSGIVAAVPVEGVGLLGRNFPVEPQRELVVRHNSFSFTHPDVRGVSRTGESASRDYLRSLAWNSHRIAGRIEGSQCSPSCDHGNQVWPPHVSQPFWHSRVPSGRRPSDGFHESCCNLTT